MSRSAKPLRSDLAKELQAGGWTLELRRGGHIKATHPDARQVLFFASTPSDHRQPKHVRTQAARLLRQSVSA